MMGRGFLSIERVKRFLGFGVSRKVESLSLQVEGLSLQVESLSMAARDSLALLRIVEERSRTLEYLSSQALFTANYQVDMQQKWYVESMPEILRLSESASVAAARSIRLETNHPIAVMSHDHVAPDSTSEGIARPTIFVRHCIDILGKDVQCLDLGVGAAALVFEYVMNGLVAIGLDGSDYCQKNGIGFWSLIPNNLRTCDITRPFWLKRAGENIKFNLITSWEVLEHIAECDVPSVLQNVQGHLAPDGYFLGSISLVEYADASGVPYHVTLRPKSWWRDKFQECGLLMLEDHPFNERLFCRGNGPRFQDFHNYFGNPDDGFHFVARANRRD